MIAYAMHEDEMYEMYKTEKGGSAEGFDKTYWAKLTNRRHGFPPETTHEDRMKFYMKKFTEECEKHLRRRG